MRACFTCLAAAGVLALGCAPSEEPKAREATESVAQPVVVTSGLGLADSLLRPNHQVQDFEGADVVFDGVSHFVVWSDHRRLLDSKIFGAHLSSMGVVGNLGGLTITPDTPDSFYHPSVAFDGTTHLVVFERAVGSARHVYGARVNASGTLLDNPPIVIDTHANLNPRPKVASAGAAGFLVVWRDERNGTPDIYGTIVFSTGEVVTTSGVPIETDLAEQFEPSIAPTPIGDYLVVWSDTRNGNQDIYGKRVSVSGSVIDATAIPISVAANSQRAPAVANAGSPGWTVVWSDDRNALFDDDVYGTVVFSDGTVASPSGDVVVQPAGSAIARSPTIVSDMIGGYLIAWSEGQPFGGDWNIRATRASASPMLLPMDVPALSVSTAADAQRAPRLSFGNSRFAAVWADDRVQSIQPNDDQASDIYATPIEPGGAIVQPSGVAVNYGSPLQAVPALAFGNGGYSAVFTDLRNATPDLFTTRIDSDGVVTTPAGVSLGSYDYGQFVPLVAYNGTHFLVAFRDAVGPAVERLDADGTPIDSSPLYLSSDQLPLDFTIDSALATDGDAFLYLWTSGEGVDTDLYAARVTTDGALASNGAFTVTAEAGPQWEPSVAFGAGYYLVAWADNGEVRAQRFGQDGERVGSALTLSSPGPRGSPRVAFDGTNFVVLWAGLDGIEPHVFATRVSPEGASLDGAGVPLWGSAGYRAVDVTFFETGYFVTLLGGPDFEAAPHDLAFARMAPDLTAIDSVPLVVAQVSTPFVWPHTASDENGTFVTLYHDDIFPAPANIARVRGYVVRYQPLGATCATDDDCFSDGCEGDVCVGCSALDDCADENPCTVDTCGTAAACQNVAMLDNTPCSGGVCIAGSCVADPSFGAGATGTSASAGSGAGGGSSETNGAGGAADAGRPHLEGGGCRMAGGTRTGGLAWLWAIGVAALGRRRWLGLLGVLPLGCAPPDEPARETVASIDQQVTTTDVGLDDGLLAPNHLADSFHGGDADFDGKYFFVWSDGRGLFEQRIFGAHVTVGGGLYEPGGIALTPNFTNDQIRPSVAYDGTEHHLVVFERIAGDFAGPDPPEHHVYGVRVRAADGSVVDDPPFLINDGANFDPHPQVASVGGNFLVAWSDERNGGRDIYGTLVSSVLGTVASPGGAPLELSLASQTDPCVAGGPAGYLVSWTDTRGGTLDIYGKRLNTAGAVLDDPAIPISTAANGQKTCTAAGLGPIGWVVVWADDRGVIFDDDLYGTIVDSAGAVLSPSGDGVGAASTGTIRAPSLATSVVAGEDALLAWSEGPLAGDAFDIRATRISVMPPTLFPSDFPPLDLSSAAGAQRAPTVAYGMQHFAVGWGDERVHAVQPSNDYRADLFATVVDEGTGTFSPGIAVNFGSPLQAVPATAFGNGGHTIVYTDLRNATADIFAARIALDGTVAAPAGTTLGNYDYQQYLPQIAFNGSHFLVVFRDVFGVAAERLDASGSPIDDAPVYVAADGFPMSKGMSVGALATDGDAFLALWTNTDLDTDLKLARITTTGAVAASTPLTIATGAGVEWGPSAAFGAGVYLVAWGNDDNNVHALLVSQAGLPIGAPFQLSSSGPSGMPRVAFDGTNFVVLWTTAFGGNIPRVRGARVAPDGTVLDPGGVPLWDDEAFSVTDLSFFETGYFVTLVGGPWAPLATHDVAFARLRPDLSIIDAEPIVARVAKAEFLVPRTSVDGNGGFLTVFNDHVQASPANITRVHGYVASYQKLGASCATDDDCFSDGCDGDVCVGCSGLGSCEDSNPCTADACGSNEACSHVAMLDNTPCSGGVCIAGSCVADPSFEAGASGVSAAASGAGGGSGVESGAGGAALDPSGRPRLEGGGCSARGGSARPALGWLCALLLMARRRARARA